MKKTLKKTSAIGLAILIILGFAAILTTLTANETAYATSNKATYITYGTLSSSGMYPNGMGFSNSPKDYTESSEKLFTVSISGQSVRSGRTAPNKSYFDFPEVTLEAEIISVLNPHYLTFSYIHKSAKLTNVSTGEIVFDKTLSGREKIILLDREVLKDDTYTLYYVLGSNNVKGYSNDYYRYTFTVDTHKPVGAVTAESGETLTNGTSTSSSFKYVAEDTNLELLEFKDPGETWREYDGSFVGSTPGTYSFRATDKSGNVSDILSVFYDASAPLGQLYADGASVAIGSYVSSVTISYTANDEGAGLKACRAKLPGRAEFTEYVSGTPFAEEGVYEFYSEDKLGNRSETLRITLDRSKPEGFLKIENDVRPTGTFSNGNVVAYSAKDAVSGIAKLYVKLPGNSFFEPYVSGTEITSEGELSFYAVDRAGNHSDVLTVVMDREKPVGILTANGAAIPSGTATHDIPAMYSASDSISGVAACYMKTAEDTDYSEYINETEITEHNDYFFYSVDRAGNVSDIATLSVDVDFPRVTIYRNDNPKIEFQASDSLTVDENLCFNVGDTIKVVLKDKSIFKKSSCNYATNRNIVVTESLPQYVEITTPSGNRLYVRIRVLTNKPAVTIDDQTIPGNQTLYYNTAKNLSWLFDSQVRKDSKSYMTLTTSGAQSWEEKLFYNTAQMPYVLDTAEGTETTFDIRIDDPINMASYRLMIDKRPPEAKIIAGGQEISNGSITNKGVVIECTEPYLKSITYTLNGGESKAYELGTELTEEGKYFFEVFDDSWNKTSLTFEIDKTPPKVQLIADKLLVENGASVNAASVTFTGSDRNDVKYYVKKHGETEFTEFSAGTLFTDELRYEFFAEDSANNRTEVFSVTLDRTAPEYSLYSDGVKVDEHSTVNAGYIEFRASDSLGTVRCFIKRPGETSYSEYISGDQVNVEGKIYFYCVDSANNRTDETYVIIDRTAPIGTLFADSAEIRDGDYVNATLLEYRATDNIGQVTLFVREPGCETFVEFSANRTFTTEGKYSFYCCDEGNIRSQTVSVTLDRTAPDYRLYAGNEVAASGTHINASYVKFEATDSVSGIANIYVRMPGDAVFTKYVSGTQLTAEGTYKFFAEDKSLNHSAEVELTLDRTKPTGTLLGGESALENNSFTNAEYVTYFGTDENVKTHYVKKPNAKEFVSYSAGTKFTAEGVYEFFCEDFAFNRSETLIVTLDKTKPVSTLYADNKVIESGAKTNAAFIELTATDALSGVAAIKVKVPSALTFSEYIAGTQFTDEGYYEFFTYDKSNNHSDTVNVILDRTKPIGTLYAGTAAIDNGGYTTANYVKFTASDALSGVTARYVKMPDDKEFIPYTEGTILSAEGKYLFYAVDGSNNRSIDYTVTIDRVKPSGTLYAGTKTVNSGTVTNAEYITFTGSDNIALRELYVKKPGATNFIAFGNGERFITEGTYAFFCEDCAGGRSEVVTITLDKTKPTGTLNVTTEYTNKPISFTATDDRSGIAKCEYRIDNGVWKNYVSGTLIPVTAENGLYTFRAYDTGNNVSDEVSVYFDTTKPVGTLFAGGTKVENDTHTNAANIRFTATDATLDTVYILTPKATEYVVYKNGALYADEGKYEFYAVDYSQNRSETYKITIDRTAPLGQLYGGEIKLENGVYTTANYVKFTASDANGIEGLFVKMPNSSVFVPYTEGTMLTAEGEFVFYAVDRGNNRSNDYSVTIDRTAPNATLYAGTKKAASGAITNAGYVTFTATDNLALVGLYVKKPNNNTFERFTSGTQFTAEGKYEFYAEDRAGLRSETLTIMLDNSKSAGQIYAGETAIGNDAYTNAKTVSFTANDDVSGVKRILVKLPSQADFAEYESGRKISENGIIVWKIEDFAGNVSDLYTVTLDTEKPSGQISGANGAIVSGAILSEDYVTFSATDNVSGIAAVYVKLPGADKFTVYEENTKITAEGTTLFYVSDEANNKSPEYSVTLDRTKPIGQISVESGYTNKAFSFTAADDRTGVTRCEYKAPGGDWTAYVAGTVIPKTAENGLYSFRAYDAANNVSEVVLVVLDTVSPTGRLYADDTARDSGGYTNLDRISFVAEDLNLAVCYVKTPNVSEWKVYTGGALYSGAGRYEFYAEDSAGNRSETYVIVIDRTPKPLTLNGVTNGTDKNVTIAWTNGNADVSAPVVSVTINGKPYENGSALNTIYGGRYLVRSEDAAGNVWTTEFDSERVNVKTTTVNKEWWEAPDADGKYFAFESYENALGYATAQESALIRTGEWTNENEWDTGIMMDAADSVNAKPGRYFIYKKSGDASVEVAYFTEERLNAVIREYAENGIRHFYYFNGSPSASAEDNDLYKLNTDGVILADKIELSDKVRYYIDGELFEGSVYDVQGRHEVVVKDDYGNEKAYTFIVVREFPSLSLAVGENEYQAADLAQIYYLKNIAKLKISDALDEFAMFYVKNGSGEIIATLSLGGEHRITASGKYVIQAVNHFGLTTELQVYISLDAPTIAFSENAEKKQFTVTVKPSGDEYAKLQSITIYKSVDDGETWVVLTVDDYGTKITTASLTYKFRTSGQYRVVVEDTFHTGFEAIELTDTFKQTAPTGTLNNAEDGGYTNKDVSFTWTDEATATVTLNEDTSDYKPETVLTAEGKYEIVLTNYDGQTFTVSFVIDKTKPVFELIGAQNGKTANADAAAKWTDKDVTATITYNGKTREYLSGNVLTEDGNYKLTLIDKAGNVSEAEFTIDKIVGITVNTADGFISNDDVTIRASEELTVTLSKDGEVIPYKFGDAITAEGEYKAELSDLYGNVKTVSFRIFKQPVARAFEFEYAGASATLNGEPLESLNFDADGVYVVTVEREGKTYSFTVMLDRSAPTLTLVGVKNGGETKSNVTLKDLSEEATIEVYLNGAKLTYKVGTSLTELGDYRVVVTDDAGNVTEYAFRILYSLNGGAVALIFIVILVIIGIVLGAVFGKKAVYKKKLKAKAEAEKEASDANAETAQTNENGEAESENPTDSGEAATEEPYDDEDET